MTLRDLLVISGLCLLTEDADEAFRLTLKKEIIHLYGEDVFERLEAIEASNEESEEVMLQILRSLAVDQEFLDVKAGIPARDAEIAALRKEIETLKATMGAEPVAVPKGWKLVPIEPTDAMLLAGYSDVHDTEIWWSLMLNAAPAAPVATPTPAFSVGVHGVGVIDDNPSALAVYFNAAPNDDDIRALHEIVSGTPVAAQAQPTRRELDMAMLIKNLARQVRRAEPYGTNYRRISDDALDALKRWGLDGSPVRTTKPEGTQSQQVDKSTEMQRQLVDRTPDLHCQQQPVSGVDASRGSGVTWADAQKLAGMPAVDSALEVFCNGGTAENALALVRAVMIAQQDADKVDAERWRAYRAAVADLDGVFLQRLESAMRDLGLDDDATPTQEQVDAAIDAARKEKS